MKAISNGATQPPGLGPPLISGCAGLEARVWAWEPGFGLGAGMSLDSSSISCSSAVGSRNPVNPCALPCPLPTSLTALVMPSCADQERAAFA